MNNLLFVLYHDFRSNSAVQVHALANRLCALGWDCAVAINGDVEDTIPNLQEVRYRPCTHADAVRRELVFRDGREADLVHAWTPREVVRLTCEQLLGRAGGNLVVHLEDNEEAILESSLRKTVRELRALDSAELDTLIPAHFSHPHRYREFLAAADGVTMLIDSLSTFVPPDIPQCTFWPAADDALFYPQDIDWTQRRSLSIPDDHIVLAYTGNVHSANAAEVSGLYEAVARLNLEGHPTTLVRTGGDHASMSDFAKAALTHVRTLGILPAHRDVPRVLAMANLLVQPGGPDQFNAYRFPSKLPEFLAMGKPVILPETNLGCHVRHRVDAFVLPLADASGIVGAVKEIWSNPALRDTLARGATNFANRYLSWDRAAAVLDRFYRSLPSRGLNPDGVRPRRSSHVNSVANDIGESHPSGVANPLRKPI